MKTTNATLYGLFCFGPLGLVLYFFSSFVMLGAFISNLPGIFSELMLLLVIILGVLALIGHMACPVVYRRHARQTPGATPPRISLENPNHYIQYFWDYIFPTIQAAGKQTARSLTLVTFAPLIAYASAFLVLDAVWRIGLFPLLIFPVLLVVVGMVLAMVRLTRMMMHLRTNDRVTPQVRSILIVALFLGAGLTAIGYWIFSLTGKKA